MPSPARKLRVPGEAPTPVERESGFTAKDAPTFAPERAVTPIPAALTGVEMVTSDPADLVVSAASEQELAQARAMASAMAPIAKQFSRVADSMEREEVKAAPLPPKHTAPMYAYEEIEALIREGREAGMTPEDALAQFGLKIPMLTTKGFLIEVGPKFAMARSAA